MRTHSYANARVARSVRLNVPELQCEERAGEWWIVGWPEGERDCGPYERRAEAEADRVGMIRFYRHERTKGYVSVDG